MQSSQLKKYMKSIPNPYTITFAVKTSEGWTDWSEPATGQFITIDIVRKQIGILRRSNRFRSMRFRIKYADRMIDDNGKQIDDYFQKQPLEKK